MSAIMTIVWVFYGAIIALGAKPGYDLLVEKDAGKVTKLLFFAALAVQCVVFIDLFCRWVV